MAAPLKLKRQQTAQKLKSNSAVADQLPVAAVLVDTPVSHLEGIYDYLVPLHLENSAVYGTKVVVPFGNTQVDGLVVGRKNKSDQIKNLKMITDISSPSGLISKAGNGAFGISSKPFRWIILESSQISTSCSDRKGRKSN